MRDGYGDYKPEYLQIQNFPSFPDFPNPLNSSFQTTISCKRDLTNNLISQFGSFLAQLQKKIPEFL